MLISRYSEKRMRGERMKKQALNTYLPQDDCNPDGEPHVFEDRVYIFGSHDKDGGDQFCMLDYEGYSADVDDLGNWKSHGIIYRAEQDPDYSEKYKHMYAPDVVRGNDGRYYLYYCMAGGAFTGPVHVAVCDTPAGQYEYYGEVRNPDGTRFWRNVTFDPAVINDDGVIRLYYGWALALPADQCPEGFRDSRSPELIEVETWMFEKTKEEILREPEGLMGGFTVELAEDMLTVVSEPRRVVPGQFDSFGTQFEGHAFFEASSMRKVGDTYYFIYSSEHEHELCYATSLYPDRDFQYGGVIISNGDIGLEGRMPEDRLNATGNNHGSIVQIKNDWYVFYHRPTRRNLFSRQGCAERIIIKSDGTIPQVEMTSCGLNGGPLIAKGTYPAVICSSLTNGNMPHIKSQGEFTGFPAVTGDEKDKFIEGVDSRTTVGYKYFDLAGSSQLTVILRGARGVLKVKTGSSERSVAFGESKEWQRVTFPAREQGVTALYLSYAGEGAIDIKELEFE